MKSAGGPARLFVFYSAKPASSLTKQRWVELLRQHYAGDWSRFTADFLPPAGVDSWEALLATTERTRMKPGGAGIHVVREWTGIVAEHYYTLAERAIRAADPDALYFGDRLPIYYDPAAVRAMAPHVDAIASELQRRQRRRLDRGLLFRRAEETVGRQAGLDLRMVFRGAREPHREPQQRPSDDGRHAGRAGIGAAAATLNFAAIPEIVGAIGSSITTIRRAGGATARITILGWSTSTTGPIGG